MKVDEKELEARKKWLFEAIHKRTLPYTQEKDIIPFSIREEVKEPEAEVPSIPPRIPAPEISQKPPSVSPPPSIETSIFEPQETEEQARKRFLEEAFKATKNEISYESPSHSDLYDIQLDYAMLPEDVKEVSKRIFRTMLDVVGWVGDKFARITLYPTMGALKTAFEGKPSEVIPSIWKGITGQEKTTFSDVLATFHIKNPTVLLLGGLIGDILLDPLTYAGVGAVSKTGKLADSLRKAGGLAKLTEDVLKMRILRKEPEILEKINFIRRRVSAGIPLKTAVEESGFTNPQFLERIEDILTLPENMKDLQKALKRKEKILQGIEKYGKLPKDVILAGEEFLGEAPLYIKRLEKLPEEKAKYLTGYKEMRLPLPFVPLPLGKFATWTVPRPLAQKIADTLSFRWYDETKRVPIPAIDKFIRTIKTMSDEDYQGFKSLLNQKEIQYMRASREELREAIEAEKTLDKVSQKYNMDRKELNLLILGAIEHKKDYFSQLHPEIQKIVKKGEEILKDEDVGRVMDKIVKKFRIISRLENVNLSAPNLEYVTHLWNFPAVENKLLLHKEYRFLVDRFKKDRFINERRMFVPVNIEDTETMRIIWKALRDLPEHKADKVLKKMLNRGLIKHPSIIEIDYMAKNGLLFPVKEGETPIIVKNIINTNPTVISAIRNATAMRFLTRDELINQIKNFGSKIPQEGWKSTRIMDLEGWYFPEELIPLIERKMTPLDTGEVTKVLNFVNRYFKKNILGYFPSWWFRNIVGSAWNNIAGGVTPTPKNILKYYLPAAKMFLFPRGKVLEKTKWISKTGEVYNLQFLKNIMEREAVTMEGLFGEILGKIPTTPKEFEEILNEITTSKKTFKKTINKMPIIGMEDPLAGTLFKANASFENFFRASLGLKIFDETGDWAKAYRAVEKVHFNYLTNNSKVDRELQKYVLFYNWYKNNWRYQLQMIAQNPGMLSIPHKAQAEGKKVFSLPPYDLVPEWILKDFVVPVGKSKLFRLENWLPVIDLNKLARPEETMTELIHPVIRFFASNIFGIDPFTERKISQPLPSGEILKKHFLGLDMDPRLINFIINSPWGRLAYTINSWFSQKEKESILPAFWTHILRYTTGIKIDIVNPINQYAIWRRLQEEALRLLSAKIRGAQRVGDWEKVWRLNLVKMREENYLKTAIPLLQIMAFEHAPEEAWSQQYEKFYEILEEGGQ